jgi:hypothetical protein
MKSETYVYARNYRIKKRGDQLFIAATAVAGQHHSSKPYATSPARNGRRHGRTR